MPERPDDLFFEKLASETPSIGSAPEELRKRIFQSLDARREDELLGELALEPAIERAPSRLKARMYSALVKAQQKSGPLLSLAETGSVCVFEKLVQIGPVADNLKQLNYCRVCHARILGERVEGAWIFWRDCPYVGFQNR